MVKMQKLMPDMFEDVYRTFLSADDPELDADDWRPLFVSRNDQPGHVGYVLRDRNQIVGMLGMIFSTREVDGKPRHRCNLHSWFVKDEHRGRSLLLMRPALQLTDCTLTDFTPTPQVCTISKRLGFRELDSSLRILLPYRRRKHFDNSEHCEVIDNASEVHGALNESDARVFRDHQLPHCRHLLVRDGKETCYVVFSRVERYVVPYCHVHFVSDPSLFAQFDAVIRRRLIAITQGRFVAVDARRVAAERLPYSCMLPMRSRQLFKSSVPAPEQIDTLYSEVSHLNLTTLPNLGGSLRKLMQRLTPTFRLRSRAASF